MKEELVLNTLLCFCWVMGRAPSDPKDTLCFKGADLLIVSIDTLRADRLGCCGNPRGFTPVLDQLAESIQFADDYMAAVRTTDASLLFRAKDVSLEAHDLKVAHAEKDSIAKTPLEQWPDSKPSSNDSR